MIEKSEHQKMLDDIENILKRLGMPYEHKDGQGYFEVYDPTLPKEEVL